MPSADEAEIQELLGELTAAWNREDAHAFGARYRSDATFTNVNGGFYIVAMNSISDMKRSFEEYLRERP
jgi:uncharacterized protein (TIGR02246 family)